MDDRLIHGEVVTAWIPTKRVPGVPDKRLLLLARLPITFNRLIKAGVALKEVNLSGTGIRGERQPFINNVSLDPKKVIACEEMQKAGCRVYYQLVLEQSVTEIGTHSKPQKKNSGFDNYELGLLDRRRQYSVRVAVDIPKTITAGGSMSAYMAPADISGTAYAIVRYA